MESFVVESYTSRKDQIHLRRKEEREGRREAKKGGMEKKKELFY
jgi:hypothetical protein